MLVVATGPDLEFGSAFSSKYGGAVEMAVGEVESEPVSPPLPSYREFCRQFPTRFASRKRRSALATQPNLGYHSASGLK